MRVGCRAACHSLRTVLRTIAFVGRYWRLQHELFCTYPDAAFLYGTVFFACNPVDDDRIYTYRDRVVLVAPGLGNPVVSSQSGYCGTLPVFDVLCDGPDLGQGVRGRVFALDQEHHQL